MQEHAAAVVGRRLWMRFAETAHILPYPRTTYRHISRDRDVADRGLDRVLRDHPELGLVVEWVTRLFPPRQNLGRRVLGCAGLLIMFVVWS